MKGMTKKQLGYFASLLISFALFLPACSGGGGGGGGSNQGGGIQNATITGTVAGTVVVAIDGNGNEIARNTATGSPKTFTLSLPIGGEYRFCFIENENTPTENFFLLYQGTTNIFQVNSATTIDLGFVDTSSGKAVPTNDPLNVSGVSSGGENSNIPNSINIAGYWDSYVPSIQANKLDVFFITANGANFTGLFGNGYNSGAFTGAIQGDRVGIVFINPGYYDSFTGQMAGEKITGSDAPTGDFAYLQKSTFYFTNFKPGDSLNSLTPQFSWTPKPGADRYLIRIMHDASVIHCDINSCITVWENDNISGTSVSFNSDGNALEKLSPQNKYRALVEAYSGNTKIDETTDIFFYP